MAIMQKHGNKPNAIEEAYLLEAKTDENFIILPDFGFTNINAKKTDLLFSNWINIGVENQYDFIKEGENGEVVFEKNENYEDIPELVRLKPKQLPEQLSDLNFLSEPEKYNDYLTIENLYEQI